MDWLLEHGYDNVVIFRDPDYASAIIGVTTDERAVYDYNKMVESLVREGMTEEEAVEWIDYNTIRALPYAGEEGPIIMYPVEEI